jgi:hypothetical protein
LYEQGVSLDEHALYGFALLGCRGKALFERHKAFSPLLAIAFFLLLGLAGLGRDENRK